MVLLLGAMLLAGCERTLVEPDSVSSAPNQVEHADVWLPILSSSDVSRVPGVWGESDGRVGVRERTASTRYAAPAPGEAASARDTPAVLLWNGLARELVSRFRENPPRAARVYALLSVAQYDALAAARGAGRGAGGSGALSGGRPVERAVVAGASLAVLASLFPAAAAELEAVAASERAQPPNGDAPALRDAGDALGRSVGERVMRYAASDGSDAAWSGEVPIGAGLWHSSAEPPLPPLLPLWGAVRTWLMTSGEQFRPPPPPVFGSPEYLDALAEVRRISDARTADQLRIARYWADGAGTATPPGHWNAIASDLIDRHSLPEIRAAWVLALVNMALMDASVSCWQAKYTYWLIRPSQADPRIGTAVPLPNFPSYTSGHAAFSGAASDVLGDVFPAERAALRAMAEEAAMSRVYAGIHYRFDSDRGLAQGARYRTARRRARTRAAPRGRLNTFGAKTYPDVRRRWRRLITFLGTVPVASG